MIVGVPKEIKNHEYRVGLTPDQVNELRQFGHQVLIEKKAGEAIGFMDEHYVMAGAEMVDQAKDVFDRSNLIVKVKEPQASECKMLKSGQTLFTYLHLAPDPGQTQALIQSNAICIAYETVTSANGRLPLLAPMSEVAGRMSIQAAAHHLEKSQGGRGLLLAGVPGVSAAHVVILGAGVVGTSAMQMAVGLGAQVTILDKNVDRLRDLDLVYGNRIQTLYSSSSNIERSVLQADVVIGSVLVPGASAPKLVTKALVAKMNPGAVLVDVAIDQGGCFETSHPTTHQEPTYLIDDVIHYCVANMPGAVARTSTIALTNATSPFVMDLANRGSEAAMLKNQHLLNGLNIYQGHVCCEAVARAQGLDYVDPISLLH
jgi:alanine dehydrogenase